MKKSECNHWIKFMGGAVPKGYEIRTFVHKGLMIRKKEGPGNGKFEWNDKLVLEFTKSSTLGQYGIYDGARRIEDKIKAFKKYKSHK